MIQAEDKQFDDNVSSQPIGLWVSIVANVVGACGGSIFFLARPGGRFRGMEPEVGMFFTFVILAGLIGMFAGLPLSIRDLFWRRKWLWGIVGAILAFTPLLAALIVSDIAAWHLNLIWD